MQINVEKQPKAQIKITVIVEKEKVKEAYKDLLNQKVATTHIDGFRLGKAPIDRVEQKLGVSTLYGEVINILLEKYYTQALKEKLIVPVSNPKVEIKEFDLEKDFEFTAKVATQPVVKISDYKKAIKDYYNEKNNAIKKENEEKLRKGEPMGHDHAHLQSHEVIDQILKNSECEVADILIEEETNRMLTRLVNQAQSIGLSMEDYLKSQNKTSESLRKEYEVAAERNLKAEFVLSKIVKDENIKVTDDEIEAAVKASGVEKPEEVLKDPIQKIYVRTILEKNSLINKIIEEIEGGNHHE